jgi:hypothetical protein
LLAALKNKQPLVVHIVRFPQLTINHAVVFFDAREAEGKIDFTIYDPNEPAQPRHIFFHRSRRTFEFPANNYFPGGRVDVYQVFHGCFY